MEKKVECGILNVLKPPGMTSFDVVAYLRGVFKTKKIGHTGTLDPAAVGVLPICVGNATRAIDFIINKNKSYRAELTLGTVTDTQDSYGNIIKEYEVKADKQKIYDTVMSFVGTYAQVPPMYSAVRVNGKKLYELARKGITVERNSRDVQIHSINVIDINNHKIIFDVTCSKGTYIRTLCSDIGERLGCGGHMSFLIRTRSGCFDIDSALTIEDIKDFSANGSLYDRLIKVDQAFSDFKDIVVTENEEKRLLNGVPINICSNDFKNGELVRVYNRLREFIALGEITTRQGCLFLKTRKLF